jgi:hypothetical protein
VLPVARRERVVPEAVSISNPPVTPMDEQLRVVAPGAIPAGFDRLTLSSVLGAHPIRPLSSGRPTCISMRHYVNRAVTIVPSSH